jgi:serine protease Do
MTRTARRTLAAILFLAPLATAARADVDLDAKTKDTVKSLVIVDFTLRNENSSREDSGQGILLSKDGVVLISGSLISEALPKEWISEIKVRTPASNFDSVPAKILGRTRDRLFTYLKTDKPIEGAPFVPGDSSDIKIGQSVFSVALSGSAAGYAIYAGKSDVRALLDVTHTLGNTASFGLTRGNSPVFDSVTGKFVGITLPSLGEAMFLRDASGSRRIELVDDEQSSVFLPLSEIADTLANVPTQPFESRRAWLAVDDTTGLHEDMRSLKGIKQPAGIVIGSVIPGESADKAGLQARDIILTIDGKEFSKNPVPDMMLMHFTRVIDQKKPGDKVVLGVLRGDKMIDIPVTLGASPKTSAEMPHVFSPKVGITTRDLVFADTYQRHLPPDTKGVIVALVKQGSPAALGTTPLRPGLLITKIDDQPVENQQQFLDLLKKEEAKPDLKEMVFVVVQTTGETQVCRVDLTK